MLKDLNPQDKASVEKFVNQTFEKMSKEKKSLQEVLGVSDKALEEIYLLGFTLYNQGLYEKARTHFQVLVTSSPKNPRFLYALASTFYQLKQYEQATALFIATLYEDAHHAEAAFHASDCFIKRGELKAACDCLDLTIAIAEEVPHYAHFKERCGLIKDSLKLKK